MKLDEIIPIYDEYAEKLTLDVGTNEIDYSIVGNFHEILTALRVLREIPSLNEDVRQLLEHDQISHSKLNQPKRVSSKTYHIIVNKLLSLHTKLQALYDFAQSLKVTNENTIQVRLPNIQNFDDLSKVSNDLKNALQTPIVSSNTNGQIDILTAERGSIWLTIALHTIGAVKLVGHLFRSALVMVKDYGEMQSTLEGVKRLKLETKAMENIVDAQQKMLDNILEAEAIAIQKEYFNPNDPEVTNRLKLSIDTIRKMANEGLLIKAGAVKEKEDEDEIKKIFPTTDNPRLVDSLTRNLASGENE